VTDHSVELRRCLSECDVVAIRKLSSHVFPNAPQPTSDKEALATIHYARTQSEWMKLYLRAYSHSWLLDHGLPSGLPDELKPKAERMYPRVVEGVGIAVKPSVASSLISKAMSDAVADAYAEGKTESSFVKSRILEARHNIKKKLFGRWLEL
jgi:hypothetical protein